MNELNSKNDHVVCEIIVESSDATKIRTFEDFAQLVELNSRSKVCGMCVSFVLTSLAQVITATGRDL